MSNGWSERTDPETHVTLMEAIECAPPAKKVTQERPRLTRREYLRQTTPILTQYGLRGSIAEMVREAEDDELLIDDPGDELLQKLSDKLKNGAWMS